MQYGATWGSLADMENNIASIPAVFAAIPIDLIDESASNPRKTFGDMKESARRRASGSPRAMR